MGGAPLAVGSGSVFGAPPGGKFEQPQASPAGGNAPEASKLKQDAVKDLCSDGGRA